MAVVETLLKILRVGVGNKQDLEIFFGQNGNTTPFP